jgi:hypothetical protein
MRFVDWLKVSLRLKPVVKSVDETRTLHVALKLSGVDACETQIDRLKAKAIELSECVQRTAAMLDEIGIRARSLERESPKATQGCQCDMCR